MNVEEWQARLVELIEMQDAFLAREGLRREQCDDCHDEGKLVIMDPQTEHCGEFVLCEDCVKSRIKGVKKRIRRMQSKEKLDA